MLKLVMIKTLHVLRPSQPGTYDNIKNALLQNFVHLIETN
jgi:hypothetical protein